MLLRGLGRFVAVVLASGTVGVGLGIAMSKLTGSDAAPVSPPLGATGPLPSRTTAPRAATTGPRLRVEVVAAVAHPILGASTDRALLSVHVRVKNAIGRAIRPKPPVLVVNGARVPVAPSAPDAAGALLAPSIGHGSTADGTLRFDVAPITAPALTDARLRLLIVGKEVALRPLLGGATTAD